VAGSITSANASILLTIPGAYSSGVLLENFSTDDILDADPQTLTAPRVGADGNVVGDYVFAMSKFRIMFQANSPSITVFYAWKALQDKDRLSVAGSMKIIVPSLGLDVDLTDVYCESLPFLPPLKKVAEPLTVSMSCNPGWQTTST
jgi:hypothetical protein